jgi:hypothetical protein
MTDSSGAFTDVLQNRNPQFSASTASPDARHQRHHRRTERRRLQPAAEHADGIDSQYQHRRRYQFDPDCAAAIRHDYNAVRDYVTTPADAGVDGTADTSAVLFGDGTMRTS